MEEEDFAASMVVMITGIDGEVMGRDNPMNKGSHTMIPLQKIWAHKI